MAKILVVEDDDILRETLAEVLQRASHEVNTAAQGSEALSKMKEAGAGYDLVVTDILMPQKEGLETIMELRKEYPSLKILAISGTQALHHFDSLMLAQRCGANETLPKPFTGKELFGMVNRLLDN